MNHSHAHTFKMEKVGFYLSVLCAIHCIATPVVVTILPYLGSKLFHDHSWEIWFIGGSLVLAGVILYNDYKKHHAKLPFVLLLGSLFIKVLEFVWIGEQYEFITGTLGALFIALAYYFNWKYKSACNC
ncbi:MerC domain-containing protein [Flectobacillus major]|uniref:MerC domain-containing protein n=1 Tax=Flectobacillus major TaxID=103 RepID=UPI0004217C97|nr:MerC domain-containing protein [Flectobacillus major]